MLLAQGWTKTLLVISNADWRNYILKVLQMLQSYHSFQWGRLDKYTRTISIQGEDWTLPEVAEGAYLSYHLFLGWSAGARSPCYSWVELGRQVTLKPPLPAARKGDVSYQLERSSEEVVETNANSMPSHSLPPLITRSSLLGHYPVHICVLLDKL